MTDVHIDIDIGTLTVMSSILRPGLRAVHPPPNYICWRNIPIDVSVKAGGDSGTCFHYTFYQFKLCSTSVYLLLVLLIYSMQTVFFQITKSLTSKLIKVPL